MSLVLDIDIGRGVVGPDTTQEFMAALIVRRG